MEILNLTVHRKESGNLIQKTSAMQVARKKLVSSYDVEEKFYQLFLQIRYWNKLLYIKRTYFAFLWQFIVLKSYWYLNHMNQEHVTETQQVSWFLWNSDNLSN